MLTADRLAEVVRELAGRPGHEKVRSLVYSLLVDGLGASSSDVVFERPLSEVRGRTDALLGETVFEFKRDLRSETGDAEEGLTRYLTDRERDTGRRFLGVATDGSLFATYELRGGRLSLLTKFAVSRDEPEAVLSWLDATVSVRPLLDPDPDVVRRELGRDSVAYGRARLRLAEVWTEAKGHPDVDLKRKLWADLLQRVYGSDIAADDLFFQHTYLSTVAKAMATLVLGVELPGPQDLLDGKPFQDAGIAGAVEADFFDWPLASKAGGELISRVARQTARFRLGAVEHDVLKGLYESLIDPEQRHDLGEYYTPDWLAARMVERASDAPLRERLLDPACGSGTFLFHAIRRLLRESDAQGNGNREALTLCCRLVLGVDVHPVAVLIARVTYLLALGDRLRDRPAISIPVYLGDSLQWNTEAFLSRREVVIRVPDSSEPLYFPLSVTADAATFDAVVDALLRFSEERAPRDAVIAWLDRMAIGDEEDRLRLATTYSQLHKLHLEGKDHIWGYIARNLSRPMWLSGDEQRSSVVVGNPPWLSYRYMSSEMQAEFRGECLRMGLWEGGKVATHQDLSAYFFARCAELYLRPGGRIAFVMPHAALTRRQFVGFRTGRFGSDTSPATTVRFREGWGFDERVQPLFPVPSCVLFAVQDAPGKLPGTITECAGHLPRRDASPAEATRGLICSQVAWPEAGSDVGSHYRDAFRQGATVVPQVLWRVEPVRVGRLGGDPETPLVESRRTRLEKAPWRDLPGLRRRVESDFIRPLYLGESVAPFRVLQPVLSLVPVDPKIGGLLDAETAREMGYVHLAGWLREAEELWTRHGTGRMKLLERLDYQKELSSQLPAAPVRIVYAASGTPRCRRALRRPRRDRAQAVLGAGPDPRRGSLSRGDPEQRGDAEARGPLAEPWSVGSAGLR